MNTPAASQFAFIEADVHVWYVNLSKDTDVTRLEPLLSPEEIQRAGRFRFPEHRQRFVITRGSLRRLLGSYLGIEASEVAFTYSAEGKPSLDVLHESDLQFNVSHSGDLAAFGFAKGRRLGVDVELMRRDIDVVDIPRRFFSCAEQRDMERLEGEKKYQAFFNCWTRKEAYVKALGSGLSLPLRDFDVSLLPNQPPQILATRPDASLAAQWSLASLDLGSQYAAAVVVEGKIRRLELREFAPL